MVLGISSLEHVESENKFFRLLDNIKNGVRKNGIVCFVINSEVNEFDKTTGEKLPPQFEVNLPTVTLEENLENIFSDWRIIKHTVSVQEYDIPRDTTVHLTSNVVTWVAMKE